MAIQVFTKDEWTVNCFVASDGETWFRGKDVATTLGYADTKQAIRVNVDIDDKKKSDELRGVCDTPLDANTKNTMYVNESGLYSLMFKSTKDEAKLFQRWLSKEVIPSLRKTGKYEVATVEP